MMTRLSFVCLSIVVMVGIALSSAPASVQADETLQYAGPNMVGWRLDVGDGVYPVGGVTLADIALSHQADKSTLRANVRKQRKMAHAIAYQRFDDDRALTARHCASFEFRLPYQPSTRNRLYAPQTIEGGLAVWDGKGARLDYQIMFQWLLNPYMSEAGTVYTSIGGPQQLGGWQRAGSLKPDTRWHVAAMCLDIPARSATMSIDGQPVPAAFEPVRKPENWGRETSARLQVEIISIYPEPTGLRLQHYAEFRNWRWAWTNRNGPVPTVVPPTASPPRTEEIAARWTYTPRGVQGPPALPAPAAGELLLLHGDLIGNGRLRWRVFDPGKATCRPRGSAEALRIRGGDASSRLARAHEVAVLLANQQGIADWRSLEVPGWCP